MNKRDQQHNPIRKQKIDSQTLEQSYSRSRKEKDGTIKKEGGFNAVKALLLKNITPPTTSVKAVEESCVTCGGPHPYYQCLATDGNAFPGYQDNIQTYVSAAAKGCLDNSRDIHDTTILVAF
ncbi:hypothetical protein Tco_0801119 [Tanacetum coccineum]|uniref:Reverse transcriptase domain-containing protein n=1 Tax=Tanacetum coccineum TaxID=301880 RepID=A0ABQ4ZXD7_9ASTR